MPRCRIAMGNLSLGLLLNHRRKLSWGLAFSKPSMILSSSGSQLVMRWQLARKIQLPSRMPSSMSLVATGACPCPRATEKKRSPRPLSSASFLRFSVGSTPGDSTKMRGLKGVLSAWVSFRSSTGGSTNLRPRALVTNEVAAKTTRSGRRQRTRIILCSSLHVDSQSPGSSDFSGSAVRYHISQPPTFCSKLLRMPLKLGRFSSSTMLSQASSLIHEGEGFAGCEERSRTMPPLRKNWYSSLLTCLAVCRMRTHIWRLSSSLWRSNRPRAVYL
mmetsp:Transcript_21941/g.60905  ORF Transcript_21941/g.60905 Transcript_21941/m.60905 type:complete len:273 (-) Transcript_21941:4321-5139(-)